MLFVPLFTPAASRNNLNLEMTWRDEWLLTRSYRFRYSTLSRSEGILPLRLRFGSGRYRSRYCTRAYGSSKRNKR